MQLKHFLEEVSIELDFNLPRHVPEDLIDAGVLTGVSIGLGGNRQFDETHITQAVEHLRKPIFSKYKKDSNR